MISKVFKKLLSISWSLFATTVVLFAILLSILKYSLPHVQHYKSDLEQVIKQHYGADVSIGEIGASWQSFGPVIVIYDAKLNASVSAPLALSVREILVEIDFWQSLLQQRFVSGAFLLDGAEVSIDSEALWNVNPNSKGSEFFDSISHLFLSQLQHFKVIDSRVIVQHKFGASQAYQIDSLNWRNSGIRHQGNGDVYVDGFSNNSISLILDLYGQRREDIFGQIYLEANKIDISPWVAPVISDHVDILSSQANFKAWADIKQGVVGDVLVDFDQSGIRWQEGETPRYLGVTDTKLSWLREEGEWIFHSNDVRLNNAKDEFARFSMAFLYTDNYQQLEMKNADLSAVSGLFSLFSATREKTNLSGASVKGVLNSLMLHWDEHKNISALVDVNNLGFLPPQKPEQAYFGIDGISMQAFWHGQQGVVEISGKDGQFHTEDTFNSQIQYNQLYAETFISAYEQSVSVAIPRLNIINDDIELKMRGQWSSLTDGYLSLYGELKGTNQDKIVHYLPKYVIPDATHSYLSSAIRKGSLDLAQIVIEGNVASFPFSHSSTNAEQGRFLVNAQLTETEFSFAEDWPSVENMQANLVVDNDLLSINALSGNFSTLTINNDVQTIIDLGAHDKQVDVLITPSNFELTEFHQLIETSPLNNIIGDVFDFVKLEGMADAQVKIQVPLGEGELGVFGEVNTSFASVSLEQIGLNVSNVEAMTTFNNNEFSVRAKAGEIYDLPIQFTVHGQQRQNGYQIDANVLHTSSIDELSMIYPSKTIERFDGEVQAQVKVSVNIDDDGFQYFVDGNADLTDIAYNIASPMQHESGQQMQLNFDMLGDETGSDMLLSLPEQLYFQGLMQPNIPGIAAAHLAIGTDSYILPDYGFDISFVLEETEFQPVLSFVLDLMSDINQTESSSEPMLASPSQITGTIERLDMIGLPWKNVSFNAQPKSDHWLFSVGAEQTLTDIKLFNDPIMPIEINSQFLKIETKQYLAEQQGIEYQAPTETAARLSNSASLIRSLPDFHITCEQCEVNGKPLGSISSTIYTQGPELVMEQFNLDYKRNSVALTGKWIGDSASGRTSLNGKVSSRYFGDWLSELGFNTGIKESDANIDLNLQWKQAPFEIETNQINGSLKFNLGDGYLSEISDQGARIFSLFSLDSLYRKLKFDFSDVFSKGLFYNEIKGEVAIKDGVAYTDNTEMDGVAGNMFIVGETDLVDKHINYDVSFKPKVMSSIPVITAVTAGLAANPLTLLGLLVFDKALEDVDVISEIKLSISGPLEQPVVEEVKRFTKRITLTEEEKKRLRELGVEAKKQQQEKN